MPHRPPIAPLAPNRRALILPGGGMRVAWQAGVVQRLHEAGLRFSFADGTSGGVMNLAALLSGVEPADLARRWRSLRPTAFVSPPSLRTLLRFPNLPAFGDFDGIAGQVLPHLGVDVDRLRDAVGIRGRFNVCDFAAKAVVPIPHEEAALPLLLAGMSLPLLTPAVEHEGRTWTDAVWIKDANLLDAVRAGADELWVAWCIGNTPRFRDGALNQYVHTIEMSAIGALNAELAEIIALNARIAAGERPHGHDRPIRVHVVRPALPIPLDPEYLSGAVTGDALVDQGYQDASRLLDALAAHPEPLFDPDPTRTPAPGRGVSFREAMRGRIAFGETDPDRGGADANAVPLALHAAIDLRDVEGFAADPAHRGTMAARLESPRLGFTLPATGASFQLFAPTGDPRLTEMIYEVGVLRAGKPFWLSGRKAVRRGPFWRLWRDTTLLRVRLHEGRDASGPVVAAGVLRLGPMDLLALLATLRARDCAGLRERAGAVAGFARFFAGHLWRTYGARP